MKKNHLPGMILLGIVLFSCSQKKVTSDNPLMIDFNTHLQAVPFDKIKPEHYKPAFDNAIEEARAELDKIIKSSRKPTFENTIEALERAGYRLKRVESIFFNINSAETNKEIQAIAQDVSPKLTAYYNDITLNEDLFKKVKQVYDSRANLKLDTEQQKLLDDTYKAFIRNGANLSPEAKAEYRKVTTELSTLSLKFEENLLAETNAYQMNLTNEADLAGLPDYVKEAAAQEAKSKNLKGWLFTLKAPSYMAFMKYADNRKLREELYQGKQFKVFS